VQNEGRGLQFESIIRLQLMIMLAI